MKPLAKRRLQSPGILPARDSRRKILLFLSFTVLIFSFTSAQLPPKTDSIKNEALFGMIRQGLASGLDSLLSSGADVQAMHGDYSALMAAALGGTLDQMKILLSHGATVNFMNKDGLTALWYAVPDSEKTVLLLDHGADFTLRSKEGNTVLTKLAGVAGTVGLFRLFIARGADLKNSSADNAALYNAAGTCDTSVLGLLLRAGINVNDTIKSGDYAIMSALNYHCFECLKMLVEYGADINVSSPMPDPADNLSALMFAGGSDDQKSFFYLLDHGANVRIKSRAGFTPLMAVQLASVDEPEMTRALLEHGADPLEKTSDGSDAFYFAQKKGNTRSLEILKKYHHP
jgi:uncharacterized protein